VILPAYGRSALSDLLPSVGTALGCTDGASAEAGVLDLPSASRYAVLLVDGLGLDLLQAHADDAPYLCSLMQASCSRSLSVGMPTTTATSLTSLGTGLPPGQHGVVGYTSRIPGTNRLLNALRWDSRVDPVQWQPHPTVFDRIARDGVTTTAVSKRAFATSGLTLASQRGADFVGADTAGERIAETVHAVRHARSLTYVYDSELDGTGHRDGCSSEAWRLQLATIDFFAERLRAELPPDVVLVVTGDHGMVDVPVTGRVDVDDEPELLDGVAVFGGEARLRHLYCRAGAVDEVAEQWRARLGDEAAVVTRAEAVAAGWFGPSVSPHVEPRIGDVLIGCLGPVAVLSSQRFALEVGLVGMHGSLTRAEMLVPLLVDAPG
jgi:Type I phosphodiesterase / nucleotide pyrophosphatase